MLQPRCPRSVQRKRVVPFGLSSDGFSDGLQTACGWGAALLIAAHDNGLHHQTPREPHSSTSEQPGLNILGPMASRLPISTAPRDGTLMQLWCRSEVVPIVGYWSKTFIGWVAYHEDVPLIRHDVTGWEPSPTRPRRGPSRWKR